MNFLKSILGRKEQWVEFDTLFSTQRLERLRIFMTENNIPYKVRAALLPVPLNPAPFGRFSHAPHRQADGRTQRPFSSVDHGQRKWLI
mgnify:CR=1 FL=1